MAAPIVQLGTAQDAREQIQADLQFDSGLGAFFGTATAASPDRGQFIRQHNHRAIQQNDRRETLQNRNRDGIGSDDVVHHQIQHRLQKSRSFRREALTQALRRDRDSQAGCHLGFGFSGGLWIVEPSGHQRLDKAFPSQF
jgi:hypothetical protein